MAGIYNTWTDQETGETVDTFAIVTPRANSLMQQVYRSKKRMRQYFSMHSPTNGQSPVCRKNEYCSWPPINILLKK
ncbi:MAG: hypothetical protein ABI184_04465 [Ginsengibacter sp.]